MDWIDLMVVIFAAAIFISMRNGRTMLKKFLETTGRGIASALSQLLICVDYIISHESHHDTEQRVSQNMASCFWINEGMNDGSGMFE